MHRNEVCISGEFVFLVFLCHCLDHHIQVMRLTNSRDLLSEVKPADSRNTMNSALERILC